MSDRKFPVIEIFGPVFQGEGVMAGQLTHFVRLGGCDYRCSWCDSMYAVAPYLVKENATQMTEGQILVALEGLQDKSGVKTVTWSGGNPAMHALQTMPQELSKCGWFQNVETQGTLYKDWMSYTDLITVSPKPPSSGMAFKPKVAEDFMKKAAKGPTCLKIVIATKTDFIWASHLVKEYRRRYAIGSYYFQPVTNIDHWKDRGSTYAQQDIILGTMNVQSWVKEDPELYFVRVMPQLHALLHGQKRGI